MPIGAATISASSSAVASLKVRSCARASP